MSIASEITRLQEAKADIKTAIENKGVTVPAAATLDEYASLVDSISGGGGGDVTVEDKDVQYIDYDGTIVAQYDADEFLALTAHPSNPNHTSEGLLAQGWNWTLSDAKTYVTNHGMLVIGQMYTTTDGATHINIDTSLLPLPNEPIGIRIKQSKQNGTTIDWGDGSPSETFYASEQYLSHTYSTVGKYTIKLNVNSDNSLSVGTSNSYFMKNTGIAGNTSSHYLCVTSINVGERVSDIYGMYCYNCETITIPSGVRVVALYYFRKLKSITFPDTSTAFVARECVEMESVAINNGYTTISSYALGDCYSLRKVCIPDTVTNANNYYITNLLNVRRLALSNSLTTIQNAQKLINLESLVIPDSFTSLGTYSFKDCHSLKKLVLGDGLTSIGQQCFENCISLKEITFGSSIETIGGSNSFTSIQSLESLTIPDTVKTIGTGVFRYSGALKTLVIGSSVTSIGSNSFTAYDVIERITIKATTPPTIAGGVFGATNNCPIYVPNGCLSAYQSATGWTAFASRMVESNP